MKSEPFLIDLKLKSEHLKTHNLRLKEVLGYGTDAQEIHR